MLTKLVLTYPDKATALQVAIALSGNPDVTEMPPDGWLNGIHYDIIEIQPVDPETGTLVPGYHLLGSWRGPANTVPAPVWAAHVPDRPSWWPRLG